MKKVLLYCIVAAVILGIFGFVADKNPQNIEVVQSETNVPAETASMEAVTVETVPETTEPPAVDGFLYLTVSSITFSVQGESEDIYVGSIPREQITWESADESIAVFEDGILTATGVGETTVSATYNDMRIECTVGCLAETEEELAALDEETLRSPKRYPPVMDDAPVTYFDDAAFIGDSISYIMFQWESIHNYLGDPLFLVRGGTSLNGFVRKYVFIYYQGKEMLPEDALSKTDVKKVFIMMGNNDLASTSVKETMDNWEVFLSRVKEKNPDIEIYLQSVTPEWKNPYGDNRRNNQIDEHNKLLKEYAEENGFHYVEIAQYIEDHTNKMASQYNLDDGMHMNEEGCYIWMQALKAYAQLEQLQMQYGEGE